jgi:hypothetical protein
MQTHQPAAAPPGKVERMQFAAQEARGRSSVRGIFYWARECGEPGGEGTGRAWVIEEDGTERRINGGDPITRAEAERLAKVGDYIFDAEP